MVKNLPCSAGDVDLVSGLSTRIPHERKKVKSLSCVRLFATPCAGVQPQLIQGIRRRDGVGEGQETTA